MKSSFIEKNKKNWGPEFAGLAKSQYKKSDDEIAAMGAYTMLYEIADNFKNGELRTEILEFAKVRMK